MKSERIAAVNDLTEQHMWDLDGVKETHRKEMNVSLCPFFYSFHL